MRKFDVESEQITFEQLLEKAKAGDEQAKTELEEFGLYMNTDDCKTYECKVQKDITAENVTNTVVTVIDKVDMLIEKFIFYFF